MADRYEFASVVDDMFKECESTKDLFKVYKTLKDDLAELLKQNLYSMLKEKGGAE